MTRECRWHQGDVPDHEAVLIRDDETGSGPGYPVYACHACVRTYGLLPLPARGGALTGRRDTAPEIPRGLG